MDKVLIGIVGFNSSDFLEDCISSALDQSWKDTSIVFFDNASSDGSADLVELKFKTVEIVKNKVNVGFGPAHNEIIGGHFFDYYIPLNPDVLLDRNYIANAVHSFKIHGSDVGAVNGLICYLHNNQKSDRIYSCGHLMFKDRRIHDLYRGELLSEINVKERFIFGPNGACPVLSRSMIFSLQIQGKFYEPIFFFTGDDIDVSWRMARSGWKCLFCPEAKAWHAAGSTRKYWSMKIRVEYIANRYLLMLRNDHPLLFARDAWIIFPVDVFYWLVNLFRHPSFAIVIILSLFKVMKYFVYIIKSRRYNRTHLSLVQLSSLYSGNYLHRIQYLLRNFLNPARRIHIPS